MKTAFAPSALTAMVNSAAKTFAQRYPLLAGILTEYQKSTLMIVACGALILYASVYLGVILTSENLLTVHNTIIGGDFIVFWSAAQAMADGQGLAIYDAATMEKLLLENFPGRESYKLTWQYPPTMFLVIAPLAALGYVPALWLWGAGSVAMFAATLLSLWRKHAALLIALSSAVAFQALITGQTGFFTAALIALAAAFAGTRPVLAGLAAGLLTVKPQFGLLIPAAFAAAGCWRAFGVAAFTGGALAAASLLMFGPEAWLAFKNAAAGHGGMMSTDVFPYHKLITMLGFLTQLGAPSIVALAGQMIVALFLVGFVFVIWRRTDQWDLRAMALCIAAPLASPYAMYYELTIFIPAIFLLAKRGIETGWLPYERPVLVALWAVPLFTPGEKGSVICFLVAAGAFALCARHIWAALKKEPSADALAA